MKKWTEYAFWTLRIIAGCAIFALAFDLFLDGHDLNSGGLTGLSMVIVRILGFGTVGTVSFLINLPLFVAGGMRVGKRFFFGSLIGTVALSVFIDLFTLIPAPEVEPLLASVYGGVLGGLGLGIVFVTGASTGGSDIVVRLLKLRFQHVPIGTINMCFDLCVAALTGIVFQDISKALYSGVAIFATGQIIDAVVYSFDYSKVAWIISCEHEKIAGEINRTLDRGATYLNGEGTYSHRDTKVILTAVKKQQIADLKRLVVEIDPNAFIIVQDAHQVLGDGFARYSKESL